MEESQRENRWQQIRRRVNLFLAENQNRKFFLTIITGIFVLIICVFIIFIFASPKPKESDKRKAIKTWITPSPLKDHPIGTVGEVIKSANFNLNCQIVLISSEKKIYLQRLERCNRPLNYKISPDGKFLAYLYSQEEQTKLFVFSLENNAELLIDEFSSFPLDFQFNNLSNLIILFNESLNYYFLPLSFRGYPDKFQVIKINTPLPKFDQPYASLVVYDQKVDIASTKKKVLYSLFFSDLQTHLTPTKEMVINRLSLKWNKRIFFFNNEQFQTMDIDGKNVISHRFICDDKEIAPFKYTENFFSRSPDGRILALVIPDDNQIAFYDFVTDGCQKTGLRQTSQYQESFSFSPNGNYLAYTTDGNIFIYVLSTKRTYQLSSYNPKHLTDAYAVTGPLVWSGNSQFIYAAVSKLEEGNPKTTSLKRIYFNNLYEGKEQELFTLPFGALYSVSPQGDKIAYQKEDSIYIYEVNRRLNSFFQKGSVSKITWLRNGNIIAKDFSFVIDYDGEFLISSENQLLKVIDLNTNQERKFYGGKNFYGTPLVFFY